MTLRIISLGAEGISYVQACLQQGTGLCGKILRLGLADGEVSAALPERTSLERAKSFHVGGLMSRHDAIAWFLEHLTSLWRIDGTGTLVLQDIWAKPTDPAVRASHVRNFFDDANVYYFLKREDAGTTSIEAGIRTLASYVFIGVFSRYSVPGDAFPPDCVVTENVLDEIARTTQEIFVSAYDQEGLVMWQRRAAPSSNPRED